MTPTAEAKAKGRLAKVCRLRLTRPMRGAFLSLMTLFTRFIKLIFS